MISYKLPGQLPCPEAEINSKSGLLLTETLEGITLFLSESHSHDLGVVVASALHQRLSCALYTTLSHVMTIQP